MTTLQLDGGSAGERQNATARLRVQGLTRTYGATRALDDFSADLLPGEVVALVGHNGAGKSTLAKLLAGLDRPSAGSIELDGHPVTLGSAKDANGHGVSLVPQRLAIVPTLTVRHNITLGLTKAPDVAPTAERLGLTALLDVHVGRLSPAAQRLVMIGRALLRRPTLMIFDEPTAAFSQREVERLFGIIRGLSADGITVLYVSHRLQEVLDIATRVLGMSQGRLISDSPTSGMSRDQLADIIAGTSTTLDQEAHLEAVGVPDALKSVAAGATALSIAGLTTPRKLRGVDLQVRRGEVLGLTGLIGAGRSSLLNTLWGTGEQPDGGSIEVGGSSFEPRSPRAAIRRGIVYVPEDRQRTSLVPSMTVTENVALASLRTRRRGRSPLLDTRRERLEISRLLEELDTKPAHAPGMNVMRLSGGNQQKAVLARWLMLPADVFLLDEPTEGVDVHARHEIYQVVRMLADAGKAVILSSSDVEEVVEHTDRVLVMREGAIVDELLGARRTLDEVSRACLY